MKYRRYANSVLVMSLALMLGWKGTVAAAQEKSADEVAKELTNPAGSLASLSNTRDYTTLGATFPVLPFPVGGRFPLLHAEKYAGAV